VAIKIEPHFEVEILRRAYNIENFEVQYFGVGHPSMPDVDTCFCSHDVYQLSDRSPAAAGRTDIDLTCGK
jgi:hypothetical protein